MAKRIVDEEMRFSVIINGDEAQKELFELEKSTRDLTQRNKDLAREKKELIQLGLKEGKRYTEITQEINANNRALDVNAKRMEVLQKEIGVTGLTMRQLNSRARSLRAQLNYMVPGSENFNRLQAELAETNARLKELRMSARATKTSIGSIADGFNRYAALGASVIATGTGMVLSIQKVIDYNSKLSDSQSNVMKTTGLTKVEVDELTKSFGMIKTRTARVELLQLAEEAGRLGITGVKNIKDFVGVANQIKVALGDDLSEEAIREVGKMTNIFRVGDQTGRNFSDSMLSLGSAINEVSASGANQAGYLVDFLKRTSGLANVANISADEMLGLAAAFDEVGVTQEIAGTAMNKTLLSMYDNVEQFAKFAGQPVEKFRKLLKEDASEAFLVFAESLSGSTMEAEDLVKSLNGIDIGGTRGAGAILSFAQAIDVARKRQETANEALIEATSLTNEYNLKNNNLAATIEKVQKRIVGAFTSDAVVNGITSMVNWFAKFIGASEDATGGVTRFRNALVFLLKLVTVVTAALVSNVAWLKILAIWEGKAAVNTILHTAAKKANIIATEAAFAAQQLYAAATMLLTGNIKGATQAIRVLSATMKTTPWGLAIGLVSAMVAAYIAFNEEAEKAVTVQSILSDATAEAQKQTAGQTEKLRVLQSVAEDVNATEEARTKAIKEINKIVPDYNKNLDLSKEALKEGKDALDKYVESLQKQAEAQFLADQVAIKSKELKEQENSSIEKHVAWYEQLWNAVKTGGNAYAYTNAMLKTGIQNRQKNIETIKQELEAAKTAYKEYIKLNPDSNVSESDFVKDFKPSIGSNGESDAEAKKKQEELKRKQQELLNLTRENNLAKARLLSDSLEREAEIERQNHENRIEDLKARLVDVTNLRGEEKRIAIEQNKQLNELILSEDEAYLNRLGTIIHKGIQEEFQEKQAAFEREKVQREIKHNEELAALGNNEEAKKALQEQFDRDEQQRQIQHLEDLKAEMQRIISQTNFEGFDLELLSEEEKQQVLDALDQIGLKLSDLINKKNALQSSQGEFDLGAAGGLDIFGFTADQWMATFEDMDTLQDKLAGAAMAVGGLSNAYAMYQQFRAEEAKKELREFEATQNERKDALKRQLDQGYINQRQYNQGVVALERETEKKKAELEYKAAKRQWAMQMSQAVGNAAMAVLNGLQAKPFLPVGIAMGALAGVLGGLQVAMVAKSKPVKGFETGFYKRRTYPIEREQDGKVFNATYGGTAKSGLVDKPTHFLAGEGGKNFPEMIIDGSSWKQMDPDVKNSLQREIARVRGYASGYYKDGDASESDSSKPSSDKDETYLLMVGALNRNSVVMEKLERNGVLAFMVKNMDNAKLMKEGIEDYEKLRNENKLGNGL